MPILSLNTQPFSFNITYQNSSVFSNLNILYPSDLISEHSLADADFNIAVRFRRFLGIPIRQVNFDLDGFTPFSPGAVEHAAAILEWGMNYCVARHIMTFQAFHAATIANSHGGIILSGDSGSGKSTLSCALMASGWRLLTDELTLYDANTQTITPFVRPVSIKETAIRVLQQTFPDLVFGQIAHNTTKGTVTHVRPSDKSWQYKGTPASPTCIIFPKFNRNQIKPKTFRLSQAETIQGLSEQSFNLNTLGSMAVAGIVDLASRVPAFRIEYANIADAIALVEELQHA